MYDRESLFGLPLPAVTPVDGTALDILANYTVPDGKRGTVDGIAYTVVAGITVTAPILDVEINGTVVGAVTLPIAATGDEGWVNLVPASGQSAEFAPGDTIELVVNTDATAGDINGSLLLRVDAG